jgi:hypothetical protein
VGSSSEQPLDLRRARPSLTRRPRSPAPPWPRSPVPPWHPLRPPSNSLEQAAARCTSATTALCWPHARPLQAFTVRREVAVRDSALAGASASVVVLFSALGVKNRFFTGFPTPTLLLPPSSRSGRTTRSGDQHEESFASSLRVAELTLRADLLSPPNTPARVRPPAAARSSAGRRAPQLRFSCISTLAVHRTKG